MATMSDPSQAEPAERTRPSLPADRTFIVQLREANDREAGSPAQGRIEHLVSGSARRFDSWSDMEAFVEQLLAARLPRADIDGEQVVP
jgi:hypothetical protein